MLRPKDTLQLLRARPVEPYRIYLSGGAQLNIQHIEAAIVGRSKMIIGVPGPSGPVERTVFCALVHITRIEPLNGHRWPKSGS